MDVLERRNAIRLLYLVISLAAALALSWLVFSHDLDVVDSDFEAFYCANVAVIQGHDPYLQQPLQTCEDRIYLHRHDSYVTPAPLPGYALAFIAPLDTLPYGVARWVWFALTAIAILLTGSALAKATGTNLILVFVCVLSIDGIAALVQGQDVPFAVLGLSLAALALQRDRPWFLALSLALAMLQPVVGLAATIGVAICRPNTRVPLASMLAFLAAVTVVWVGLPATVEYAVRVLPAQSSAEFPSAQQTALGPALYQLGIAQPLAKTISLLTLSLAFAVGIMVGRRAGMWSSNPGYYVAAPSAFVLFGGTYAHVWLLACALPFVLLTLRERGNDVWFRVLTVTVLVPWLWLAESPAFLLLAATCIAWMAALLFRKGIVVIGFTTAVMAVIVLANVTCAHSLIQAPPFAFTAHATDIAQVSWAAAERAYGTVCSGPALHIMQWITIGALFGVLSAAAFLALKMEHRASAMCDAST